jgi:hypothetical protein
MKPVTLRTAVCSVVALACALALQPSLVGAQGIGWTIQNTPTDQAPSSLSSVSCFTASSCIAAGRSTNPKGYTVPAAEHWNGSAWDRLTLPDPKQSTDAELLGMSCLVAPFCFAVGFATYPYSTTPQLPIAEVRSASAVWSVHLGISPPGAARGLFNGASCVSTTHCMVVGEYSRPGTSTPNTPLAESWFGTGWAPKTAPLPAGATAASLESVICSATNACTAVGYYISSTSQVLPLVETWNGTKWAVKSVPGSGQLLALACTGTTSCIAVGCATTTIGCAGGPPLVELWDGTNWTVGPTPDGTYLNDVSCTSATTCVAVGASSAGTYATGWDGTSWTDQTTPNPTGATAPVLNGISCVTATSCEAVGSYLDSTSVQETLAEVYAG